MRGLRTHLTYANVISTLCLVLIVGGGAAYAANTVGSSDIIDGQVYSADVRNDTLTGGGLAATDLRSSSVTTAEIADNQVRSGDVRDEGLSGGGLAAIDLGPGSVGSSEVAADSLSSADIANGGLNDEDVGQLAIVNFAGTIGNVPHNNCVDRAVTGIDVQTDHLMLTPSFHDASAGLVYGAQYKEQLGTMDITVCNPTNSDIDDGTTHFNLLVIDAQ